MKLDVPDWLGPRQPNRTRGFLVTKYILFIVLVIGVIETVAYSPIYYGILEKDAIAKLPPGQEPNVWVLVLSTIASVAFGLVVFAIGMTACLREHFHLTLVYAAVLFVGMIWTLVQFMNNAIVIVSFVITSLVIALALFYAHMIRKNNAR